MRVGWAIFILVSPNTHMLSSSEVALEFGPYLTGSYAPLRRASGSRFPDEDLHSALSSLPPPLSRGNHEATICREATTRRPYVARSA